MQYSSSGSKSPLQRSPNNNSKSIQSYQRTIYRLQTQNINLQQQLQSLRYKLRNIQDIQVKYELLLGQSQNQNQRLKLNELILQKKTTQHIQSIIQSKQRQFNQQQRRLQQQYNKQILQLRQKNQQQKQQQIMKYNQLKSLYQSILNKSSQIDVFSFKLKKYQKQISQLEEQLENTKLSNQINLNKLLSEQKLAINKKIKSKYQIELQNYQNQIKSSNHTINQLQLENDLLKQKLKFININQQSTNIQKLKQIINQRKYLERQDTNHLQQALDKSNNNLRKIIEEKYQVQQKYSNKQSQLKQYIKQLENQLLEKQKSHTKQIFTLQAKYQTINQQQTQTLKQHIQTLKSKFQSQKQLWDSLAYDHAQQIKQLRDQQQKSKQQFQQQKNKFKLKIKQLKQRLQDTQGKRLQGQTQQMISSLKDLDGRQDKLTNYQHGVVFFQKQLSKSHITISKKDKEINKLLQDITKLRQQNQQQVTQWRQKYKTQKKQFIDKIFNLQNDVRDLSDKLRFKQRQLQKNQKQTNFKQLELEKRIQTLQDINQQIKKDYDRAIATNKTLQQEYRGQRDRGVSAKGDANYAKRMKWLELQKQKNQLNIIFRQKQEQLKIVYEKQIDQLRNQRDTLKQKATLLQDEKKRLLSQNGELQKKVDNKQNLNGRSTKKKSGDMQKKIASLNLQIALTKNLFENLQKAKSRLKSRDFTKKVKEQSEVNQNQQQNEQDYD